LEKQNPEQFKAILTKYGLDPPPDALVEICENISALGGIIKSFEARKSNIKINNKKHGRIK